MPSPEKDRLAAEAMQCWADLQASLSDKQKDPVQQFRAFWAATKRYAELTSHRRTKEQECTNGGKPKR